MWEVLAAYGKVEFLEECGVEMTTISITIRLTGY